MICALLTVMWYKLKDILGGYMFLVMEKDYQILSKSNFEF